jgi:hypothetical protein
MKARFVILLVIMAALASQKALAQNTSVSLPLKAGQFSTVTTGSLPSV